MPLQNSVVTLLAVAFVAVPAATGGTFFYHVEGKELGSWPAVLSSAGLMEGDRASARIFVLRSGPAAAEPEWRKAVEQGAFLILEGDSEIAASFGFRAGNHRVAARNVRDERMPKLPIIWERQLELPVFEVPPDAKIFARERWSGAPLMAGYRSGKGGVLWIAVAPGIQGHERFPYILAALADIGLQPPFRSRGLWAFFDSSYRSRVDLEYFARRWRAAGLSALHVAAWHYFEPDPERDAWLARLIEECHRQAVGVYAWLELPHVSERFWDEHPEWREKTAIFQDAHLDWRKLMNLANPACSRAVSDGLHGLIDRFDWDGVNLAELYFESLEGSANPARFTPMNDEVRAGFGALHGFDPAELFGDGSRSGDAAALRQFLDYRAEIARRLQEHWVGEIEQARRRKPHLALVLTHVDDRFDTRMKELIGADAAGLLPLLDRHDFTFLVEDPATVWNLGAERYPRIASEYAPLTPHREKLAIDINIVERYQDVYPTKQQTGTELLRQVRLASLAFPRVALYAEHSLLRPDLAFLPSAAATVTRVEQTGGKLTVVSLRDVGIPWDGPAKVNGRLWPAMDRSTVWLPAGTHVIESTGQAPEMRLVDLSGSLETAACVPGGLQFSYRGSSRSFAVVDKRPARIEIDGVEETLEPMERDDGFVIALPRGQHLVSLDVKLSAAPADLPGE